MKRNLNLKNYIGILLSALLFLTSAASDVWAQLANGQSDRIHVEHYLGSHSGRINLSVAQRTRMTELISQFRQDTKSLRDQLTAHCAANSSTLGSFDESAVRSAAQSRHNVSVEIEVARSRLTAELIGLLTVEQKTQLAELRRECEEQRQKTRELLQS